MRTERQRFPRHLVTAMLVGALLWAMPALAEEEEDEFEIEQAPLEVAAPGSLAEASPLMPTAAAVVNLKTLALEQAAAALRPPQLLVRSWMPNEFEAPPEPWFPPAPESGANTRIPITPFVASPSPLYSYQGLDDIAMVDSSYIVIPPDISGGVGLSRVMESFNNNYRVRDKATGATLITVGTATFWAPVVAAGERLSLTDPRIAYDPYNNRWLSVMQTTTTGAGKILLAVSQTSDPAGSWYLYSYNSGFTLDFPSLGFNKNWVSIAVNRYSALGTFQRGINLVLDYPSARAGTGTGTLFTMASGTHFSNAPCATYSATQDTLFLVQHLSTTAATYQLDRITGTPAAPVYTNGSTQTRTGGAWVNPSGNILPQSAPVSGSSNCGATPCKVETQDSYVRSAPVYRNGYIWYAQTIGLPSGGLTRTAAQWTRIVAPSGAYSDGGRIDDPTATATNGGKWYAYPHIAVNSLGDFIVGYSQFSSAQHPSAGYSIHMAADAPGSIRDPLIYHAGEDYYHKTFSTTNGRNRWGDFSSAQVDPADDLTLWTLQQYAKTRPGTDDGNTGSNSSRWSSWWAGVATAYTINASAGPGGSISPSGAVAVPAGADQTFNMNADPCYVVADVLVDGGSVGPVLSYTFSGVNANHTISVTFVPVSYTITASAGPGGSISPTGVVPVNCGANQGFTITADSCHVVDDVLVDGVSIGPVTSHTFTGVNANHTISASFAAVSYTITAAAGPGGAISPAGLVSVPCGGDQDFTITPDPCFSVADVIVDGHSVGPVTSYSFNDVVNNHTITASFSQNGFTITASAGPGGSITPNGAVGVACGDSLAFVIAPNAGFAIADVLVDAVSVGPVAAYTFHNVTGHHTIAASFVDVECPTVTVTAPNGGETLTIGDLAVLTWTDGDNVGVTCVDVLLSTAGAGGPFTALASCVPDSGHFSWTVTGPTTNDAFVKVVAHDAAGNACDDASDAAFQIIDNVSGVDLVGPITEFALGLARPNPTSGATRIEYQLPRPSHVRLSVIDLQGREVAVLVDASQAEGRYQATWDGNTASGRAARGVYFIRYVGGGRNFTQRLVLAR